jgi:hypothetical protein
MNKLRLELDALQVDSFETSWLDSRLGTVHGEQDKFSAGENTQCGGVQTCGDGCQGKVSAGPVTECGGVQTCGAGCPDRLTAGGPTNCGGIHTCAEGCKA